MSTSRAPSLRGLRSRRSASSPSASTPAAQTAASALPTAAPAATPPSLFAAAIDRIRDTAKWIIAAFAAIGVAIAGESVLSNVGEASGVRLAVAIIAASAGLGAVAVAIWQTATVLLPDQVSVQDITKYSKLTAALDADPIVFRGTASSSREFVETYTERSNDFLAAARDCREHPTDESKQRLSDTRKQIFELTPIIDGLTDITLYEKVRQTFERARWWIFGGAVSAGVALVVFSAAANPPEEIPGVQTTGTSAPVPVNVSLTDAGAELLRSELGCDNRTVQAVAVAGEAAAMDVVTVDPACHTTRFTLTPELGTAIPTERVGAR